MYLKNDLGLEELSGTKGYARNRGGEKKKKQKPGKTAVTANPGLDKAQLLKKRLHRKKPRKGLKSGSGDQQGMSKLNIKEPAKAR